MLVSLFVCLLVCLFVCWLLHCSLNTVFYATAIIATASYKMVVLVLMLVVVIADLAIAKIMIVNLAIDSGSDSKAR